MSLIRNILGLTYDYAVSLLVRKPRIFITPFLGVVLAMVLIFSPLMLYEYHSKDHILNNLGEIPFHTGMSVEIYPDHPRSTYRNISNDLQALKGIKDPYVFITMTSETMNVYVIPDSLNASLPNDTGSIRFGDISGTVPPPHDPSGNNSHQVAISYDLAEEHDLKIGDSVSLIMATNGRNPKDMCSGESTNESCIIIRINCVVSDIIDGQRTKGDDHHMLFDMGIYETMIMALRNEELIPHSIRTKIEIRFQYAFSHKDTLSRIQTENTYAGIRNRVKGILSAHLIIYSSTIQIDNYYNEVISSSSSDPPFESQWIIIGLCASLLVLAIKISYEGSEYLYAERYRDLFLFRLRGMTRRHLLVQNIMQSVIIGILAGIGGLLFSAIISSVHDRLFFSTPMASSIPGYVIIASPLLWFSLAFGMIFMIASTKNLFRLWVQNMTKLAELFVLPRAYQSNEWDLDSKLLLSSLSIFILVMIWYHAFDTVTPENASPMYEIIQFIYSVMVILLNIALPFLFLYGCINILVRKPNIIILKICAMLDYLKMIDFCMITNSFRTNDKAIHGYTVSLTWLIAIIVIASNMYVIEKDVQVRTIRSEIGGDVRIEISSSFSSVRLTEMFDFFSNTSNVASINLIVKDRGKIYRNGTYVDIDLYLLKSSDSLQRLYFDRDVINKEEYRSIRQLHGGVILSDTYKYDGSMEDDDHISLYYEYYNSTHRLMSVERMFSARIAARTTIIPGVEETFDRPMKEWIAVELDHYLEMTAQFFSNRTITKPIRYFSKPIFIIHFERSAHADELLNIILREIPTTNYEIRVKSEEISDCNLLQGSLFFLLIVKNFAILFGIVSSMVLYAMYIMSMAINRRQYLFKLVKDQVILGLRYENTVILIFCMSVGVVIGVISTFLWIMSLNIYSGVVFQRHLLVDLSDFQYLLLFFAFFAWISPIISKKYLYDMQIKDYDFFP